MTLSTPRRQQDPWAQHFAAVAADRETSRRRIHAAAITALLLHGLFFALRFPQSQRLALEVAEPIRFPLTDFRPRPRPVEPDPPPVPEAAPVAQPTIVVPGPPEAEPLPIVEAPPIVLELPPAIEPLDLFPATPPPPPEPAPVRYDASIERPVRIYSPLPAYTPVARKLRRQGRVVLEAVIDIEGRVSEAKILKSLGFGLDESALETVSTWRFEPARRNGSPIAVIYNLVINFQID